MVLLTGRSFLQIVRKLLVLPLVLGLVLFLSASIHDGYTTSFTSTQSWSQNDSGTSVVSTFPVELSPHDLVYDGGSGYVFVTKGATTMSESVTNAKASTSVAMSCSPSSINVGRFTICNANVTGLSPTGSVVFSKSSSTGNFTSPGAVCGNNCPGTYHTSYTDTAASSITVSITASYSGDTNNNPSTGTFSLSIARPAGVITVGVGEFGIGLGGISGGLTANQSSTTGISVTITGATESFGWPVDVTTETLSEPNSGVPAPDLASPAYYDVFVRGILSGNAQVCIPSRTAVSSTTMQYWTGATWKNASDIRLNAGTVCGTIPVSALSGTNLVLGTPKPTIIGLDPMVFYIIVGVIVAAVVTVSIALVARRRERSRSGA
jgi:hypothetical protein